MLSFMVQVFQFDFLVVASVNFLHFLCFDVKIRAKNSNNPPREKISRAAGYYGYSLTEVRISLSISARFVLYPFTLSKKMFVSR